MSSSYEAAKNEETTVATGSPPNSPLTFSASAAAAAAANNNNNNNKQKCLHVDIILPDGSLRQVEVDFKAFGQECLDKICTSLGILEEVDYFGLTYLGPKQEELWVNTRNRMCKQLPTTGPAVCRMHLKVKFFVQPHMLLQEEARHLFFLDVRSQLIEQGNWLDEWRQSASLQAQPETTPTQPPTRLAELIALLAQAEFGDFDPQRTPIKYQKYWHEPPGGGAGSSGDIPGEVIAAAAEFQRRLAGWSPARAEYRALQLAAGLAMYGCHYHEVKDCYEAKLCIAVGPSAICVCKENKTLVDRYPYPRVQKVTISDRVLYLSLSQENGSVKEVGYRLVSQKAANGLYRCVTETHSFFRCDTVRTDVSAQTSRDIKGALVSFFTEHDNSMARDFVFDIQRTAKEVHDDARRRLYRCAASAASSPTALAASGSGGGGGAFSFDDSQPPLAPPWLGDSPTTPPLSPTDTGGAAAAAHGGDEARSAEEVLQLKEQLQSLEQSRLCRICVDSGIDLVFIPCGHMVACRACADRLADCPLCRQPISVRQPCYAPWNA